MDEIDLVIEGWIINQRYQRRNTWAILCSLGQQSKSMEDLLPLPYDDEIESGPGELSNEELMRRAYESGYFDKPI